MNSVARSDIVELTFTLQHSFSMSTGSLKKVLYETITLNWTMGKWLV